MVVKGKCSSVTRIKLILKKLDLGHMPEGHNASSTKLFTHRLLLSRLCACLWGTVDLLGPTPSISSQAVNSGLWTVWNSRCVEKEDAAGSRNVLWGFIWWVNIP